MHKRLYDPVHIIVLPNLALGFVATAMHLAVRSGLAARPVDLCLALGNEAWARTCSSVAADMPMSLADIATAVCLPPGPGDATTVADWATLYVLTGGLIATRDC